MRLYSLGEVDEDVIRGELAAVRSQRQEIQDRLKSLQHRFAIAGKGVDPELLSQACAAVAKWLDQADEANWTLALEALQVVVQVTRDALTVRGILPIELPEFITDEGSCRCSSSGEYNRRIPVPDFAQDSDSETGRWRLSHIEGRCSFNGDKLGGRDGVPFSVTVAL